MNRNEFDRSEHVYRNEAFVELVKDAVRFFNGTPVHAFPLTQTFTGTGVYAIYYTGDFPPYSTYKKLNRLSYDFPIYVGKAVPKGWRQSRTSDSSENQSTELYSRLRQHSNSITTVTNLNVFDFSCRLMIFEDEGSDMISTIEATLIKLFKPLWNVHLDGFGNHDPGKGRYEQAKSDWDVIHSGRLFAEKCKGQANSTASILSRIKQAVKSIK
jgi:hypothetical protein